MSLIRNGLSTTCKPACTAGIHVVLCATYVYSGAVDSFTENHYPYWRTYQVVVVTDLDFNGFKIHARQALVQSLVLLACPRLFVPVAPAH